MSLFINNYVVSFILHLQYDVDAYLYSITIVTIFDIQFLFVNMEFRIGTVEEM